MISGGCPYCDGLVFNEMPDDSPKAYESTCEHCGEVYWVWASRLGPVAYTQEGFAEKYIVDRDARTITERSTGDSDR